MVLLTMAASSPSSTRFTDNYELKEELGRRSPPKECVKFASEGPISVQFQTIPWEYCAWAMLCAKFGRSCQHASI
ncbi:hypothetical protein D918_03628 [Trichuris suis]|nr:hypothetical protein D918_03628 [Trichuris suis]